MKKVTFDLASGLCIKYCLKKIILLTTFQFF